MKASKNILGKILCCVVSISCLLNLSACSQPKSDSTTDYPIVETSVPAVKRSSTTVVPPSFGSPTTPTVNQNLAQLAQSASNQGSFKMLTKVMHAAHLTQQMAEQGPYTVFAPTDTAFAALPKGTIDNLFQLENKQQLVRLLRYHIIPGQVTSSQIASGTVNTVEGTPVTIKVNSSTNTVTVNDARVIQADIPASNGVVHVVDKVILPPNLQASPNSNQVAQ